MSLNRFSHLIGKKLLIWPITAPPPHFAQQNERSRPWTNNAYTETKNTLPRSIRFRSVGLLNCSLASAIDLERQATQAHWNVKGPNFIAPHELFDKVAEATEEFSDLLAERVTALGGTAEGRLQAVTRQSALPVYPGEIFSGREHVDALSTSLAAFGKARGCARRSTKPQSTSLAAFRQGGA